MSILCTNVAVMHSTNQKELEAIVSNVKSTFECYTSIEIEDNRCEFEFSSYSSFPQKEFEEITKKYPDNGLYIQIVTYELSKEYVAHHVYKNGVWIDMLRERILKHLILIIMKKVDKQYSLHNSYFKNKKHNYPGTVLEIVQYKCMYGELPFSCLEANWLYQTIIERQKRCGVQNNQYLTPEKTASQIAELTNNFIPKDNLVLDACCGTEQLTKFLLLNKLNVVGFDNDPDMVEICKLVYPQAKFELFDFKEHENLTQFDLIVSNPPHDQKNMIPFFKWLSLSLTDEGKAILLISKGFMSKETPRILKELLSYFEVLHQESMSESFVHTKGEHEICIVALSIRSL